MESKFSKIENKAQWQALLDRALFKTFFHSLEWEEFLEKEFKWLKFERYQYKDSAILSLARVKGKLVSHPFCEYGGPLPLIGKIDGMEFKQDLFTAFEEPLRINLHPKVLEYFGNFGLRAEDSWRNTFWLENLSQTKSQDIFSALRYDIRHSIKEAESQGFVFEECNNPKDLKNFYQLYLKTVRRHRNIPLPFSFFEFFSHSAKIFLLKSGQKIATGSVFLPCRPFVHYFITAADASFRKQGVNHLLLWSVIQKYLGQDFDYFDLGATSRGSNLEIFKRGWRGRELPIFEISNRPPGSGLRRSPLRNLLGLLPSWLSQKAIKYKI